MDLRRICLALDDVEDGDVARVSPGLLAVHLGRNLKNKSLGCCKQWTGCQRDVREIREMSDTIMFLL